MKVAYHLTKKSIPINAKLRHYSTGICLEALYVAECLTLNKKIIMEELEVTERKISRKILVSIKDGEQYRRPVSYTHLDVYKRQAVDLVMMNICGRNK